MTDFVTKADAYPQLRLDVDSDGSPDDRWLDIWIPAVSAAIRAWLKDDWRAYQLARDSSGELVLDSSGDPTPEVDSSGEPLVHPLVRGACLLELERRNANRAGGRDDQTDVPTELGGGYILGNGATALLAGLRKTTIA